MDTSKKYIKMCEEAKEIQKIWKWDSKDYKATPEYKSLHAGMILRDIWLPRQDQLQEMLMHKELPEIALYMRLANYIKSNIYYVQFKSMEQLWLTFTMKEKYNKIWKRVTWIKN